MEEQRRLAHLPGAADRQAGQPGGQSRLRRYGADGFGALYDRLCDTTRELYLELVRHPDFTPLHEPESNILCFRWTGGETSGEDERDARNLQIRERYNRSGDGWITTTILNGRRVLRVTVMNPRTTGKHVRRLVAGLAAEGGQGPGIRR